MLPSERDVHHYGGKWSLHHDITTIIVYNRYGQQLVLEAWHIVPLIEMTIVIFYKYIFLFWTVYVMLAVHNLAFQHQINPDEDTWL